MTEVRGPVEEVTGNFAPCVVESRAKDSDCKRGPVSAVRPCVGQNGEELLLSLPTSPPKPQERG